MPANREKKLFIIDGSSLVYRAFHAVPASFRNSNGLPTNAVYGFTQTLKKILHDFCPDYVAVAFDVKGPTFRHAIYAEYKAERPPMPDALSLQMPYIKKMASAFGVKVIESRSFEADDIIATIAKRTASSGIKTGIITGDKDMYQLVDSNTVILDYLSGKECGAREVEEKFGVGPVLIRDLMGLAGDASDGIPGVPGIGFKTAAKLLKEYGSLDAVFENIEGVKGKLKDNLLKNKEQALLSRELATLHMDVPFEWSLEELKYSGPDYKELAALLKELEFEKLLKEVVSTAEGTGLTPSPEGAGCRMIGSSLELKSLLDEVSKDGALAITLTMSTEGFSGRLMAASVAKDKNEAFHISVESAGARTEIAEDAERFLRAVIQDGDIKKDTDSAKALHLYALKSGYFCGGIRIDTSIASYLLNPSKPDHSLDAIAYEYLGVLQKEDAFSGGDIAAASKKVINIGLLAELLDKELDKEGLKDLYLEMELPLTEVLAWMEFNGVRVDKESLHGLSKEIEVRLLKAESSIYGAVGREFNINSPKQLSEVLFERLKLKPLKRTKTGFSTDEEVLTQLARGHEAPSLILSYRQLQKVKSTYVDAILELIEAQTGRVHTSFNQTVTATGRLSSSRPNLQNIPVRGEWAGRIREAFIAGEGNLLLCADYSQIELRIVAHMAGERHLIDAFKAGEDIHSRTASEIFGVLPGAVTSELRRRAKAINFGIIYGMGSYGLSSELGISVKEASDYIDRYFLRYSAVKSFIDRTIEEAKVKGYTTTLFGRRRFIPELSSPLDATVRFGERMAINTPIQGTAADMIKAAMITVTREIRKRRLKSMMILQIHDELVFEAPLAEKEEISALVRAAMEGVVSLSVPVLVNIKTGENWKVVE